MTDCQYQPDSWFPIQIDNLIWPQATMKDKFKKLYFPNGEMKVAGLLNNFKNRCDGWEFCKFCISSLWYFWKEKKNLFGNSIFIILNFYGNLLEKISEILVLE